MKETNVESGINFEGPRRIRASERLDGNKLFELCFGHQNSIDPDESENDAEDGGWYVMLPTSGPLQGKPVSQINISHSQLSFSGSRLRIGSIGGVCTHPDFRGMGLAGRVLERCTEKLEEEGARLMLISGGRGLYTRTGNVPAMCFTHYQLLGSAGTKNTFFPAITLRQPGAGDNVVISRLYQSEAVGYLRDLDEYPARFGPGRAWLIEMDGNPVAYLISRVPWEYWGGPERGVREVVEYAGSRLALAAGLSQLVNGTDDPEPPAILKEIRLAVPWQDVDLTRLLHLVGLNGSPGPLGGHTLRLINFPALRKDLEAYMVARLPNRLHCHLRFEQSGPLLVNPDLGEQTGDQCAILYGDQRLELSTAQMTNLVFGDGEAHRKAWTDTMPDDSPLAEIINNLFPLPSFQPGLNYR